MSFRKMIGVDGNLNPISISHQYLTNVLTDSDPLLICTGFLKYPFGHLFQTEIKIDFKTN